MGARSTILYSTYDHYEQIHRGVAEYCRSHGFKVKVLQSHNWKSFVALNEVAGVVSSFEPEGQSTGMNEFLLGLGCPIVDLSMNYLELGIPRFVPDLRLSGKLSAGHLVDGGARYLSYVGWGGTWHDELRVEGFVGAAAERGFEVEAVYFGEKFGELQAFLKKRLENQGRPMGIYVSYDRLGCEVIETARALGLRVPEDMAIICGQHRELDSALAEIPLTTVDLNQSVQGYDAASALHQMIRGEEVAAEVCFTEGGKIVQRETTRETLGPLGAAVRYIDGNLGKATGVDELAKVVGVSRATLQRIFKDGFGHGVATEVRLRRIERAKGSLREDGISATAIAEKLGFGDVSQFYRAFKKVTGVSTGEFRRRD